MNTKARIATVCQGGRREKTIEKNREYVMGLLDAALAEQPDLVCLPEAFATVGLDVPLAERVESVPGPTTDAAARRAREHRAYVICPLKTERDGRFWNSAVILDRQGQVAGAYDKVCPVTSTPDYTVMEGGVTPGEAAPVFDLDFGRIGVQICFDLGFAENWASLAEQGARLVVWPSAYDGGFPLRAFAYLHHYYVVSSVRHGTSRIIDPLGAVLHETTPAAPVIRRDLNLDFLPVHFDFNHMTPKAIEQAYGARVEVRQSAPGSGHFLVEPVDPAVRTDTLRREFGLETTQEYHDRHRTAYAALRTGETPPPQPAAHGSRSQYGP
jgi:beta-ureidopropionase